MLKNTFVEAFESYLFGTALSINVLSVIKDSLGDYYKSFPAIVYVGEPGVGKTTLVEACLIYEAEKLSFSNRPKMVENVLESTEKNIVFLDDLADYKAQGMRERGFKHVDGAVRNAYAGKGPIVVLTAERKALIRQADSCRERMLCIDADQVLMGKNLNILEFLQENKVELCKLFDEFSEWYSSKSYNFKDMLRHFRTVNSKKGTVRQISLVFAYYASVKVLSDFLESHNHCILDQDKLLQNVDLLINSISIKSIKETNIIDITNMLSIAVRSGRFRPQYISPKELCASYLNGRCCNFMYNCESICSEESRFDKEEWLDPQDLITNFDEGFNSVLIQDIHWIKGCPKYILHEPVLIIDNETLKCIINDFLLKESITKKLAIPEWSDIAIHKKLYENRQCFYLPNGLSKCRYTMNYRCFCNDAVISQRVCMLRLTQEQFDILVEQSQTYRTQYCNYRIQNVHSMIRILNNFIGNLQYTPGEIGKSIYEEVK